MNGMNELSLSSVSNMPILFNSLVLQKRNIFCYCCDNILTLRPGKYNSLRPTEMNVSIHFLFVMLQLEIFDHHVKFFLVEHLAIYYFVPTK